MATKKDTPLPVEGAGSVLSTVAAPSTGAPPKSLGKSSATPADLLKKMVGTAALAATQPNNANKPWEFDPDPHALPAGAHFKPSAAVVTSSTVTENTASDKVGNGVPPQSENRTVGSLDRVRVDSGSQQITTNQGVAVADNQNSLKIGLRGPTALEDFILREKITHFDHERIPERVVHASGAGAHGVFKPYKSMVQYTSAGFCKTRTLKRRCLCVFRP